MHLLSAAARRSKSKVCRWRDNFMTSLPVDWIMTSLSGSGGFRPFCDRFYNGRSSTSSTCSRSGRWRSSTRSSNHDRSTSTGSHSTRRLWDDIPWHTQTEFKPTPYCCCQAWFPFKRNRLRCVRCVNENRKKRKRLRWQAANHGCHCFDRAFLLAGAYARTQRKRLRLNGNRASEAILATCSLSLSLYY